MQCQAMAAQESALLVDRVVFAILVDPGGAMHTSYDTVRA
jgi:hypothetical protein